MSEELWGNEARPLCSFLGGVLRLFLFKASLIPLLGFHAHLPCGLQGHVDSLRRTLWYSWALLRPKGRMGPQEAGVGLGH